MSQVTTMAVETAVENPELTPSEVTTITNLIFAALNSTQRGAARPDTAVDGTIWQDSATDQIFLANDTDDTDFQIAVNVGAPASASATGTAGDVAWDDTYFYMCTATDTWKRVALATW